jgi:hypothetical protein
MEDTPRPEEVKDGLVEHDRLGHAPGSSISAPQGSNSDASGHVGKTTPSDLS